MITSQRKETKLVEKTPVMLFGLIGKVLEVQRFLFVMLLFMTSPLTSKVSAIISNNILLLFVIIY